MNKFVRKRNKMDVEGFALLAPTHIQYRAGKMKKTVTTGIDLIYSTVPLLKT